MLGKGAEQTASGMRVADTVAISRIPAGQPTKGLCQGPHRTWETPTPDPLHALPVAVPAHPSHPLGPATPSKGLRYLLLATGFQATCPGHVGAAAQSLELRVTEAGMVVVRPPAAG